MEKYKIIIFIVLILVFIISGILIYNNEIKNKEQNQQEKITAQIDFLETKFVNLFNALNNIETRNYSISVKEMSKQTTEKVDEGASSEGGDASKKENKTSTGGNLENSNTETNKEDQNNEDSQKYELRLSGILTNPNEIDWENIKGEIEILYTSIPTITLDLYEAKVNKEEILAFNNEYDKLITIAKNQNKEETLMQLSVLYGYIPKFLENTTNDEIKKSIIETKKYIFNAYSRLDTQDWNYIGENVKNAINEYSKLMTNINIDKNKMHTVNKAYVIINEMQNAVDIKDTSVFLIKYKNLLEELDNI